MYSSCLVWVRFFVLRSFVSTDSTNWHYLLPFRSFTLRSAGCAFYVRISFGHTIHPIIIRVRASKYRHNTTQHNWGATNPYPRTHKLNAPHRARALVRKHCRVLKMEEEGRFCDALSAIAQLVQAKVSLRNYVCVRVTVCARTRKTVAATAQHDMHACVFVCVWYVLCCVWGKRMVRLRGFVRACSEKLQVR